MTLLNRRTVLLALGALLVPACHGSVPKLNETQGLFADIDMQVISEISKSYKSSVKAKVSARELKHLFENGDINLRALNSAIKEDFRQRRIFSHKGWRLSHVEGKILTLYNNLHIRAH